MRCCKKLCCENKINSSYITWLVEVLGPVLMGSKPSEIISIPFHDNNRDNKLEEISNHFSKCSKIEYIFIERENISLKILFVNRSALEKKLSCRKCQNFLKFLGYPKYVTVDSYLDHLVSKISSDNFPDEIGIFLGYPIKDVVGFMGYGNYSISSTKYWRVYGDPKPSEDLYSKFINHRSKMRDLIKTMSLDNILASF